MALFEMVRNGGFLAMAALAAGLLGVVVGAIGFAVRGKGAVGIGVATALIGTLAAGCGIGGTFYGKHLTDQALGAVSPVDAERIRPIGYREAQDAGWVGFGASLLPLLMAAAHLLRARSSVPTTVSLTQSREENPAPISAAAFAFVGLGAMAALGALVLARAPIPLGKLGLDPEDSDAWDLASAIENAGREPWTGCTQLDAAIEKFSEPVKGAGWPRTFKREPPKTLDWRPAANACVERWTGHGERKPGGPDTEARPTIEAMMQSPLVHDTRLRGLVLEKKNEPNEAPPVPATKEDVEAVMKNAIDRIEQKLEERGVKVPKEPEGEALSSQDVAKVVKAARPQFTGCYERALVKNPKLSGKLVVQFTVAPNGTVPVVVEKSDPPFPDQGTTACVMGKFRALKFPASGRPTTITYPFVFSAAK